jgi:hypothetical protein
VNNKYYLVDRSLLADGSLSINPDIHMRNNACFSWLPILCIFVFSHCSDKAGSEAGRFAIVPLKDFKYAPAMLTSGTEIRILAFSGDNENTKEAVYYSQFIGIEKTSGDTLRILTAFISVDPNGSSSNTLFTTPVLFDGNKGVLDATFQIPNSNQQMILRMDLPGGGDAKDIGKKITASLQDTIAKKEYVIVQKDIALFTGHYKTAIGILNFKEQPW